MTTFANAVVPIRKPGDAAHNPTIMEYMDRVIQMVGQTKTPFLNRVMWKNISGSGTPTPNYILDTYYEPEEQSRSYGSTISVSSVHNPTTQQVVLESRHKAISISEEEERTAKYGVKSRSMYERMKIGIALRVGLERSILNNNQGSQAADSANSNIGKSATLEAVLNTHVRLGNGAATKGGWNKTTGVFTARSRSQNDGDRKVLTYDDMLELHNDIQNSNSSPDVHNEFWMSAKFKRVCSGFSQNGVGQQRTQITAGMAATVTSNVKMIHTDLDGGFTLNWSPQFDDDNANLFLVDPSKVELCSLFRNLPFILGKTALSKEFGIATNWGLKLKTEAGAGALFDRKVA